VCRSRNYRPINRCGVSAGQLRVCLCAALASSCRRRASGPPERRGTTRSIKRSRCTRAGSIPPGSLKGRDRYGSLLFGSRRAESTARVRGRNLLGLCRSNNSADLARVVSSASKRRNPHARTVTGTVAATERRGCIVAARVKVEKVGNLSLDVEPAIGSWPRVCRGGSCRSTRSLSLPLLLSGVVARGDPSELDANRSRAISECLTASSLSFQRQFSEREFPFPALGSAVDPESDSPSAGLFILSFSRSRSLLAVPPNDSNNFKLLAAGRIARG